MKPNVILAGVKKILFIFFIFNVFVCSTNGQHCAPITKTDLNEVSVVRVDSSLKFQFEFVKSGGQIKEAYQVYFLAYFEKDKDAVFKEEKMKIDG
ncbi:MAG: hypothetical protein HC831_16220 [Chloroflexia bacterium]|nr:hypothetical protein [Chloroflexia bacterium]